MKIKYKLLLSNAVILLLIAVLYVCASSGFSRLEANYASLLNHPSAAMENLRELQNDFTGQANDERGFLLTGEDTYAKEIKDKAEHAKAIAEELKGQLDSEQGLHTLNQIMEAHAKFTQINLQVVATYNSGKKTEAQALSFGDGRKTRKELTALFDQLVNETSERIVSESAEVHRSKEITMKVLLAAGILAALTGLSVGILIYRSVGRPLIALNRKMKEIAEGEGDLTVALEIRSKDEIGELAGSFNHMMAKLRELIASVKMNMAAAVSGAGELKAVTAHASRATEEIAASMQEVATGAETQLRRSDDSLKALEELASGVQRVAEMTAEFAQATAVTAKEAGEGNRLLQEAIGQMDRVYESVGISTEVVTRLGDRSEEIREIAGVITGIAGQTNLLALNASIEAARAGEQGRGFAVVAGEIRKLADQTEQSVQRISGLIDAIVSETGSAAVSMKRGSGEVSAGLQHIHEAGTVFGRILKEIRHVDAQVQDVSATAQEMSAISEQVTASVSESTSISHQSFSHTQQVTALTEEQLASMEEAAASSEQLSGLTGQVEQLLGKFKV